MTYRFILGFVCLLGVAGCVQVAPAQVFGGVFKSFDSGTNWEQKVFVSEGENRPVTISNANVTELVFDPLDQETIYLATNNRGLLKSANAGEQWLPLGITSGGVNNFSINVKNTDEMYVSRGNQVSKSTDGGLSWNVVYTENRGIFIQDLAVDAFQPDRVYALLQSGELVRSNNRGVSWTVFHDFDNEMARLLIDPRDTRKIYAFTKTEGFFKSTNLGRDWTHITESFNDFDGAKGFKDIQFDFTRPDSLLYASDFGLLRSTDGGFTWNDLVLLTEPGEANILAVAQNPINAQEIYYTTPQGLVKSFDGGTSWITNPLPTSHQARIIAVDPTDGSVLYLGTFQVAQKSSGLF